MEAAVLASQLVIDLKPPRDRGWNLPVGKLELAKGYSITSMIELPHAQKLLVTCGDGHLYRLSERLEVERQVKAHSGSIRSCRYDLGRRVAISGGEDYRLKAYDDQLQELWSSEKDVCIHRVVCLLDHPSRCIVATSRGANDGFGIRLWEPFANQVLGTLDGHEDTIRGIVAAGDGQHFLSCSEDATVRVWQFGDLRRPRQTSCLVRRGKVTGLLHNGFYQLSAVLEQGGVTLLRGLEGRLLRALMPFRNGRVDELVALDRECFLVAAEDGRIGRLAWTSGELLEKLGVRVCLAVALLVRQPQSSRLLLGDKLGTLHSIELEE